MQKAILQCPLWALYVQQRRIVQNADGILDLPQLIIGYMQPVVKSIDELISDLFRWHGSNVVIRRLEDRFLPKDDVY